MEKIYWKSLDQKQEHTGEEAHKENKEELKENNFLVQPEKVSSSRRDFLKWAGISFFSAAVVSACENPVRKAIPYLNKPEEVTPAKSSWYASCYVNGNEFCPVVVRSRDGRPVKTEGNKLSSVTMGGTSARAQASVLSLYDIAARYKTPMKNGSEISWENADSEIISLLEKINKQNGRIVLLTPTLLSPSTINLLEEAKQKFTSLEIISWDAISCSAIRTANKESFGVDILPDYRIDQTNLLISFSADFLGTWLSPVEYAWQYAIKRQPDEKENKMLKHIQFESSYSISGANADERVQVKPSEEKNFILALHDALARETGNQTMGAPGVSYPVRELAMEILQNKGKTLVLCGHNNPDLQILVNSINMMAASYGNTISFNNPYNTWKSQEQEFENMVNDLQQGEINAVIFYNTNPVYHYQNPDAIIEGIKKAGLSISFSTTKDETSGLCQYILPDNHYLESWGDIEFKKGHYNIIQPLIHRIFNTRQFQDSLLGFLQKPGSYHEYLKKFWETEIYPGSSALNSFDSFWRETVQSGVFEPGIKSNSTGYSYNPEAGQKAFQNIVKEKNPGSEIEFTTYSSIPMADGHTANNPWLQELPEPVSSVAWGNYAAISPLMAHELGLKEGDIININKKLEIPVLIQPGQAYGCISMALGYGRTNAGKTGNNIGTNAFPLTEVNNGHRIFSGLITSWQKTGSGYEFSKTQSHFSMEGRAIVRESSLEEYKKDPSSGNELHYYHKKHKNTLYPETKYKGHHWLMMVDLNACIGCEACVISCQCENNIPVVGKEEVKRRRIMHWIRIDRYYSGDAENPDIVFQPLMCQHCDHAPCENVCPVAATPHSSEGLNQMAYNRCVGTKYCINNCPYKVRRFNWYEYSTREKFNSHTTTDLGRMVLNPDVVVRERGVVEKCSFCIQRIQEAKLNAKTQGRLIRDGEVQPACVSACPAGALIFGDRNDKNSRVARLLKDPRNYHLLEELHTLPSVGYLTKIRYRRDNLIS